MPEWPRNRVMLLCTNILDRTWPQAIGHGILRIAENGTDVVTASHSPLSDTGVIISDMRGFIVPHELVEEVPKFMRPLCFLQDPDAPPNPNLRAQVSDLVLWYLDYAGYKPTGGAPWSKPNVTNAYNQIVNNPKFQAWWREGNAANGAMAAQPAARLQAMQEPMVSGVLPVPTYYPGRMFVPGGGRQGAIAGPNERGLANVQNMHAAGPPRSSYQSADLRPVHPIPGRNDMPNRFNSVQYGPVPAPAPALVHHNNRSYQETGNGMAPMNTYPPNSFSATAYAYTDRRAPGSQNRMREAPLAVPNPHGEDDAQESARKKKALEKSMEKSMEALRKHQAPWGSLPNTSLPGRGHLPGRPVVTQGAGNQGTVKSSGPSSARAGGSKASVVAASSNTALIAAPTESLVVKLPYKASATAAPSKASFVAAPTKVSAIAGPSKAPVIAVPSKTSATATLSKAPVTAAPTKTSATAAQSKASVVAAPTKAPVPPTQHVKGQVSKDSKGPSGSGGKGKLPAEIMSSDSVEVIDLTGTPSTTRSATPVASETPAPTAPNRSEGLAEEFAEEIADAKQAGWTDDEMEAVLGLIMLKRGS